MIRSILIYGIVAGAISIGGGIWGIAVADAESSMAFLAYLGYLTMLVALSVIFIGIKRYRDHHLGGIIKFTTGLQIGVGIAAVAGVIYVGVWEVYLAMTDHDFIGQYAASIIADKQAAGVTGAELEAVIQDMEQLQTSYADPLFRLPMTFVEIFPVGLVIALVSSAILRFSHVLPAKSEL